MKMWAKDKGWKVSRSEEGDKEILKLTHGKREGVNIRCVNNEKNGTSYSRIIFLIQGDGSVVTTETEAATADSETAGETETATEEAETAAEPSCSVTENLPSDGTVTGVVTHGEISGSNYMLDVKLDGNDAACDPASLWTAGTWYSEYLLRIAESKKVRFWVKGREIYAADVLDCDFDDGRGWIVGKLIQGERTSYSDEAPIVKLDLAHSCGQTVTVGPFSPDSIPKVATTNNEGVLESDGGIWMMNDNYDQIGPLVEGFYLISRTSSGSYAFVQTLSEP
jgi:hypothetical protein